eukprot:3841460-Pleurochrysis_carterae.AAC.1
MAPAAVDTASLFGATSHASAKAHPARFAASSRLIRPTSPSRMPEHASVTFGFRQHSIDPCDALHDFGGHAWQMGRSSRLQHLESLRFPVELVEKVGALEAAERGEIGERILEGGKRK